jgi:hypothetical protein
MHQNSQSPPSQAQTTPPTALAPRFRSLRSSFARRAIEALQAQRDSGKEKEKKTREGQVKVGSGVHECGCEDGRIWKGHLHSQPYAHGPCGSVLTPPPRVGTFTYSPLISFWDMLRYCPFIQLSNWKLVEGEQGRVTCSLDHQEGDVIAHSSVPHCVLDSRRTA